MGGGYARVVLVRREVLAVIVAVAVGLAAAGCGGGSEGAGGALSIVRDTEGSGDVATGSATTGETSVSCPFDGAAIEQGTSITAQMDLLSGEDGTSVCMLGTPGTSGEVGVDRSEPLVTVDRKDAGMCDYEHLDPGFLPYQGGDRAAPEYGAGAWKVIAPSTESQGGFQGGAHVKLDGSCVEIYFFNPDGGEADTEQQLDELVRLALG